MKDPTRSSTPILTALLTVALAAAGGCGPSERPMTPSDAMSPKTPAANDPSDPASKPLTAADAAPAPGQARSTNFCSTCRVVTS